MDGTLLVWVHPLDIREGLLDSVQFGQNGSDRAVRGRLAYRLAPGVYSRPVESKCLGGNREDTGILAVSAIRVDPDVESSGARASTLSVGSSRRFAKRTGR